MKELRIRLGNSPAVVQLGEKITKEDLYGDVRTVVEKEGRRLEYGYLSPEGELLRRAQISSVSVDTEGTPAEPPVVWVDDKPAEAVPSSFDKESELREVPLSRLVGFNVTDVYAVESADLKPALYETTFNYRKTYLPKDALLLVKPGKAGQPGPEAFLLVGHFKKSTLIGKNLAYEFFDSSEPDAAETDPLDFSMM